MDEELQAACDKFSAALEDANRAFITLSIAYVEMKEHLTDKD